MRLAPSRLAPYLVSAAAVAAVAFAAHLMTRFVSLPHVSVLFIAAVVASAAVYGFWPAVFAAVLSVAASSFFFYSPIFSFQVADVQDIADLVVFVVVAALTSRLAADVRAQALRAQLRQETIEKLLAFSERIAASMTDAQVHRAILEYLAPVLGRPIHLLLPVSPSGPAPARLEVAASLDAHPGELPGTVLDAGGRVLAGLDASCPGWRLERLSTAQAGVGVVAAAATEARATGEYAKALAGHAALALERARLRSEVAEARLKVQGEALREALIDSVSHELHTPLAAILGSASALETLGEHGDRRGRQELVATIREEAERLASHIENVLDLTRIRAGQMTPRLELVELSDIVDAALRRKQRVLARHVVAVELPADLPMLRLDLFLMEHALANVLDNCAKYVAPGSRVTIAAAREDAMQQDESVVLRVDDAGPGLAPEELERIFEPFYRSAPGAGARPSGTGLGLAICRRFVEAVGGSVRASLREQGGLSVQIRLPVPKAAQPEPSVLDDE